MSQLFPYWRPTHLSNAGQGSDAAHPSYSGTQPDNASMTAMAGEEKAGKPGTNHILLTKASHVATANCQDKEVPFPQVPGCRGGQRRVSCGRSCPIRAYKTTNVCSKAHLTSNLVIFSCPQMCITITGKYAQKCTSLQGQDHVLKDGWDLGLLGTRANSTESVLEVCLHLFVVKPINWP